MLLKDPQEIGGAVAEFSQEYVAVQQDPTRPKSQLWMKLARGMAADTHYTQHTDNPHSLPVDTPTEVTEYCIEQYVDSSRLSSDYCQFASGWYQGYSSYLIIETVAGTKGALKSVSSASDLRKTLDDAGDTIDSGPGLRQADSINTKTGKVNHRIVADGGSPQFDILPVQRHIQDEYGVDAAGTSGKQVKAAKTADQLDERTVTVLADGSGDLDASFRRGVHRAADDDAVSYGQIDRAVQQIDDLEGAANTRAKQLIRGTDGNGIRLVNELDDDAIDAFFRIEQNSGFDRSPDFTQWRENLASGSGELDSSTVNGYVKHVDEAVDHPRISNPDGLLEDVSGSQATGSQIRGQAGESKSAVRYADDGADVTVEPGRGDYDLAVTRDGQTKYVEVKTAGPETSLDGNYWDRQITEMNKKFSNSDDVSRGDAVLEVQSTRSPSELDFAVSELELMLDTRVEKNFGEVRIYSTNADERIVSVNP